MNSRSSSPSGSRLSNAITEVELGLSGPGDFFVDLSAHQNCEVRLEETTRLPDDTVVEFLAAWGCTAGAIRERAAESAAVDSVRIVAERDEDTVFRATPSGRSVRETVRTTGAVPGSIVATEGTGRVVAHVPGNVDPAEVFETVRARHPEARLVAHRKRDVPAPIFTPCSVAHALRERTTDRQWEVLRTAYRNGYFQRPRERTGEEVAEMLGISSATFSQHLRSALYNLLSFAIEEDATVRD